MPIANIALGSNLGDPKINLAKATIEMDKLGKVVSRSRLYLTKPWGVTDQPDFYNAAIQLETNLAPRDLLTELKAIEQRMGRTDTIRWGPRLIDLDILTYDDLSIDEPGLTLPHPRMAERAFVLVPLCDVDSRFVAARDALSEASLQEVQSLGKL